MTDVCEMAEVSKSTQMLSDQDIFDLKSILWGFGTQNHVFRQWTQGFEFSAAEPSALVQCAGGPCAVLAPVQAFILRAMIFSHNKTNAWNTVTESERNTYLCEAFCDILKQTEPADDKYTLITTQHTVTPLLPHAQLSPPAGPSNATPPNDVDAQLRDDDAPVRDDDGASSAKRARVSDEREFHASLRCVACGREELAGTAAALLSEWLGHQGVLLFLYSVLLTKGVARVKWEVEDPSEALIDSLHGHGSQSLINLLLTGRAVSHVWDHDKNVSGLTLRGVARQADCGFLTRLEHLRYCEVGWFLKNPRYPVWLLGSETHLTVLFSCERSLVETESPAAQARRAFSRLDVEGAGFISAALLPDLLAAVDLIAEPPEYVAIMEEKLDPESLGIVTLNAFLEEFFPAPVSAHGAAAAARFTVFHYNGLARDTQGVTYREGAALLLDVPETQLISDTSPIKTCLSTKWPTIELTWLDQLAPSID